MNFDFNKFWLFFKNLPWYSKLISIIGLSATVIGLTVFCGCSSVGSIDWDIMNKQIIP